MLRTAEIKLGNCLAGSIRFLLFSVCILSLVLISVSASEADRAKLIVGGDHRNPPYEYLENGNPAGFNVELMRALAEVMGLDIEIRLSPWNKARKDLEEGRIDILTGMYYSEERSNLVDFSVPHTMVTPGIFVRQESPIHSFKDIRGKEIIVQDEDVIHDLLKKDGLASRIVSLTNADEVLRLLASGKHDCAIVPSRLQGELFIKKFGLTNIRAVNSELPPFKYCFAVAEGNRDLLSRIDEGMNILKANGKYQKIYEKWFGVYEKRGLWKTGKYLITALALIAILFAASLIWSHSLKKQVELRTAELRKSEEKLREAHSELENRVEERSAELKAANEQLRTSELEKSLILNSSTELITFQDLDMRILWANQNAADELNMTTAELVGRSCYELRHQRSEPCPGCPVVLARETGKPQKAEMPAANVGGTVLIRGYPVKNERGELIGMAEFVLDITEQKKAEEALKSSEARYRAVVNAFDGIIYICSPDRHIRFMNKKFIERTGYDATGELCHKVLHNRDSACPWCVNERVQKGETVRWEVQSPKDHRWYYVINTPIYNSDGSISKQAMIFDITDRKRMEETLRASEEKYRELVQNANSIILRMDPEGHVTFFNEFAQRFFGYSEEEILGRDMVGTIVPETDSNGRDLKTLIKDIGRNPERYENNENENMRRNGERVWIAWTNKAVRHSTADALEVLCIGNDMTAHKKTEEELRKYREKLEGLVEERTSKLVQANRELESSREQLRNLYAHKQSMIEQQRAKIAREVHDELGQMLTVLKMDLVWIKDRMSADQQALADKIQMDIRVADETIQSVKKICTELRPGILDMLGLGAAIEWKASEFQKRSGIVCKTKIEADGVDLDKERRIAIFRIFQEALTNILRHANATEVTISLKSRENMAVLEVCDNGIGITDDKLSKSGSFGLLGMRERVYPWGGEVAISGISKKGTTVKVSVPVS